MRVDDCSSPLLLEARCFCAHILRHFALRIIGMSGSRLFVPYRAIGLVAENAPFVTYTVGAEVYIAIPVGKCFQVLQVSDLKVKKTSAPRSRPIRAIASRVTSSSSRAKRKLEDTAKADQGSLDIWHLTSCGSSILIWKNNSQIGVIKGHSSEVSYMIDFSGFLVSIANESNEMFLWAYDVDDESEIAKTEQNQTPFCISRPLSSTTLPGRVSAICHPETYLNKILIAYTTGGVDLWNFRKMKKLFSFFTTQQSYVTSIHQSHVVDVVAFGFSDGLILIHNIKKNQEVCRFHMDGNAPISSMDFHSVTHSSSTDNDESLSPLLASSSNLGHIAFWDLKKKKMISLLMNAHHDAIIKLQFLEKEPLMISSGSDNSIKLWIFDKVGENPRVLKERSGHSSPPHRIRFSEDGEMLFCAGGDRALRIFSVFKSAQLQEMSQGNLLHSAKATRRSIEDLRLPVIREFDFSNSKSRFWDSLVSIHRGSNLAQTWSIERKAIGEHSLKLPSMEEITVIFAFKMRLICFA
jgi:U3 small nucleolar RNA-associated protein 21